MNTDGQVMPALTAADLAMLMPDAADQVWACALLGLDDTDDWYDGRLDVRTLGSYELGSILVALEDLPDVVDRARFDGGARHPVRRIDVAVGWGQTRRCAQPGTHVAFRLDETAVIVWAEPEGGAFGVRLFAVAAAEATTEAALDLIADLVATTASTWRHQAVLISPSEPGLFTHLPPDDVDDLVLGDDLDDELTTNLVTPVVRYDELRQIVPRRGVLLYGPPGTGKTCAARVVRARCGAAATVLVATPKALVHPEMVRLMYQMASEAAPTVVVLEDLDVTIGDRSTSRAPEALGELLAQLDGPGRRDGVFTIATTNHIGALDAALARRPGRFDRRVFVGPAADNVRRAALKVIAARHDAVGHLAELVSATDGWTLAEIAELERLAVLRAATSGAPIDLTGAAARSIRPDQPPHPQRHQPAGAYL